MNQTKESCGRQQPLECIRVTWESLKQDTASATANDEEQAYSTYLFQFLRHYSINNCQSDEQWSYKQSYQTLLDEQNTAVLLNPHNSPTANHIKSINYQLNKKDADIAYFWPLWNSSHRQQFIRNVEFVIQRESWDLYRYDFERSFELLISIYNNKLSKAPFIRKLYPGLHELIQKIAKVVEYDPYKVGIKCEETYTMAYYEHYLQEMESKSKLMGAYYIIDQDDPKKVKVPIGDVIARSPLFQGKHQWTDIFLTAGIYKRRELERRSYIDRDMEEESRRSRQNRQIMSKRLEQGEDVLPPEDRPCCAQFFYFNYRIYDKMATHCHVLTQRKFKSLWQASQKKQPTQQKQKRSQQQKQQKPRQTAQMYGTLRDICALLNSGGGVILFNIFKNYLQFWPKGELIESYKFDATRQLFATKLQCIYPPVELERQIFISFVPVVKNPISEGLAERGTRKYLQGLYVMRIVVRPSEESPQQIYFIPRDNVPFQVPVIDNGASKVLTHRMALKFMKKKFAYYYIPERDYEDEQQLAMLRRGYSRLHDHEICLKPDRGLPFVAKAAPQGRLSLQEIQMRFKYLTLLVAPKLYHGVIAEQLKSKGIECEIVVHYERYKFRAANNSAALFHNTRFDILLNEVAYKKEYQFNGKYVLTILVTPFIKLVDRNKNNHLPLQDFQTLQGWLRTEHPNEVLTLWRYEQSKDSYEFYLQANSKMATLFMYYVMNHYGEKCSLKTPKGYERMAEHERNAKMRIFYPTNRQDNRT